MFFVLAIQTSANGGSAISQCDRYHLKAGRWMSGNAALDRVMLLFLKQW
ncbi:hypothetical protein [Chamaesiphon sp. VAR_69_metabat_338]|nr:hypothetical protein [Chamaesiphon sp. VAR_69_metabat_338]